jgi:hypothetical protein
MENRKLRSVADTRTVDIADEYAIDYWIKELNTTKPKLLAAVAAVGDSFTAVRRRLKS